MQCLSMVCVGLVLIQTPSKTEPFAVLKHKMLSPCSQAALPAALML